MTALGSLRFVGLAVALGAVSAGTGCSNNAVPTTPTTTPTTFTEVFTGTLNQNGGSSHSFISQASGTVSLTLTTLQPDATQPIGIALGTWTGVACQIVIASDRAVPGVTINGAVGSAGSLCARAYDVGNVPAGTAFTYEFSVIHP